MEIQSMELEPTKENILSTLTENLLGRNNDVWRFIRICQYQKRKCSIALDAKWGAGKTFFVKQAKMLIDAYNPFSKELLDDEKKIIQSIFNQIGLVIRDDFLSSPQVSVYYDAWTNDNDNDPMLSILYEIVKTTTLEYDVHKQGNIAEKVVSIVDVITGKNIKEAFEVFRGDDCFSSIQNQKNIHSMIEEFFDSLLSEQGDRLVVFIDELDRCKPSFAIQLLERIKHYFSNDRITFVFSINDAQLQQTIKRYYGADFDSCRYLDRFFDYRISLPPANMQRYYEKIGLNSYDVFEKICQAVTRRQNMGLREIEKYARMSRMALEKHRDHRSYYSFDYGQGLDFAMWIIVPIIIGLKMTNTKEYYDFIEGRDPQPLIDLLSDGNTARGYCSLLLDRTESFYDGSNDETETVKLENKLLQVYKGLFCSDKTGDDSFLVGQCTFNSAIKNEVMRISSLLSKYASY